MSALATAASLQGFDLVVIVAYLALLLGLGGLLGKLVKNSKDMFAAGGQSPWWLSGISAYMTMFSSGTFVVWGGIAFKAGMVAVSISTCLGISAFLVGAFLARRWKETGATSAAEYVRARFGPAAVQTYTWLGLVFRLLGSAVALYSIAVLICALIPISDDAAQGNAFLSLLQDSETKALSVPLAIVITGIVVMVISGNLWAVLITDTLQFIVLGASVLIVVPMLFSEVGGIAAFRERAPDGFFQLANSEFTWIFLVGWVVIHAFKVGGEWAFVQRFLCVPRRRDAVKAAYLFGVLYVVSPLIWMLPPMLFRILEPSADPKEAYILACQAVLPAGLVGLMISAMFSATVSMVDSEINVYGGALTRDLYAPLRGKGPDDPSLVRVGHWITNVLGGIVIVLAILIPKMGGAEDVVLTITGLFAVPLVLPVVWSLFSRRIGLSAVFWAVGIGALFSAGLKYHEALLSPFGLASSETLGFIETYNRTLQVIAGLVPPLVTLLLLERTARGENPGHARANELRQHLAASEATASSRVPALVMAWGCAALSLVFLIVGATNERFRSLVLGAGIGLLLIALLIFLLAKRRPEPPSPTSTP